MKRLCSSAAVSASIAILICVVSTSAFGELKTFTVDPTQSSLSVTGSFAGIPLGEQGPGSLSTHCGGIINVDVTATTVQFPGGSSIVASNSGSWQPGPGGLPGTAPANYGGQGGNAFAYGLAAIRNAVIDITSGAIVLNAGTFPAWSLEVGFPTNASSMVDYIYNFLGNVGNASRPLAGRTTNNVLTSASLTTLGNEQVLTFPLNFSGYATAITTNDVQFTFTGQIVARASAITPLQIGNFQVTPGQLEFAMDTQPGHSYTILASTNLMDWSMTNDQFVATDPTTTRTIPLPARPGLFFRIRQDN